MTTTNEALTAACPLCNAQPGHPCRTTANGVRTREVHQVQG